MKIKLWKEIWINYHKAFSVEIASEPKYFVSDIAWNHRWVLRNLFELMADLLDITENIQRE